MGEANVEAAANPKSAPPRKVGVLFTKIVTERWRPQVIELDARSCCAA